jgi:hypothetical protein
VPRSGSEAFESAGGSTVANGDLQDPLGPLQTGIPAGQVTLVAQDLAEAVEGAAHPRVVGADRRLEDAQGAGGVLPRSGGAISCRAMDTTVVAQSAIGALSALIGGLGGAAIATRPQRSNEQRRQRERAAEVLGLLWPLLIELDPNLMLLRIPPVEMGRTRWRNASRG